MKRVVWLQTSTVFWLGGWTISLSHWMCMGLMILGLWGWDSYWKAQKIEHHSILIKSQKNWLQEEVGQFVPRSIKLLILFWIRRNCLNSEMSQSYLCIRRIVKHCSNCRGISLLSTAYKTLSSILLWLTPFAEGITGDHQCGFLHDRSTADHIFCMHYTVWETIGIQCVSASGVYVCKESLWFN
jgi:hypothetical protein